VKPWSCFLSLRQYISEFSGYRLYSQFNFNNFNFRSKRIKGNRCCSCSLPSFISVTNGGRQLFCGIKISIGVRSCATLGSATLGPLSTSFPRKKVSGRLRDQIPSLWGLDHKLYPGHCCQRRCRMPGVRHVNFLLSVDFKQRLRQIRVPQVA